MREPEIVSSGTSAVPPGGGRAVDGRYPGVPAMGEIAPIPALEMSVSYRGRSTRLCHCRPDGERLHSAEIPAIRETAIEPLGSTRLKAVLAPLKASLFRASGRIVLITAILGLRHARGSTAI